MDLPLERERDRLLQMANSLVERVCSMEKTGNTIDHHKTMHLERDMSMDNLKDLTTMSITRHQTMTGTASITGHRHLTTAMALPHQTTKINPVSIASMVRLRPCRQATYTCRTHHRLAKTDHQRALSALRILNIVVRLLELTTATIVDLLRTSSMIQEITSTTTTTTLPPTGLSNCVPHLGRKSAKPSSRSSQLHEKSKQATFTPTLLPTICTSSTSTD